MRRKEAAGQRAASAGPDRHCRVRDAGVWYTTICPPRASRSFSTMPRQLVVKPINQDFSLKGHIYEVLKQGIVSI